MPQLENDVKPEVKLNLEAKLANRQKLELLERELKKLHDRTAKELREVTAMLAEMHNHLNNEHSESNPASLLEQVVHGELHVEKELTSLEEKAYQAALDTVHEALDKVGSLVSDINRVNRAKVAGEVPTTVRDSYKQAGAPLPGRLFGNSSASSLASSQTLTSSSDSELEFSSRSPSLSSSG